MQPLKITSQDDSIEFSRICSETRDEELVLSVFQQPASRFLRNAVCFFTCIVIQPWCLTNSALADVSAGALTPDAAQAADILGVRQEAEQIILMRKSGSSSNTDTHQLNNYRSLVLRKVFEADLQNQVAESRLEFEIAYAYDAIMREQRKENTVNQLFNIANFTQFGVLGVLGGVCDINEKFVWESTLGLVSAGVGTSLPILGIIYNRQAKAHHLSPPSFMSPYVNGKPVDGSNLPPLIVRYLNTPAPGESRTRREVLNASWKQNYRADMANTNTLLGIADGKARSQNYLNNRLTLLWSLYTSIEGFNSDLLSLLNQVRGKAKTDYSTPDTRIPSTALGGGADDAARLLNLEEVVAELEALNTAGGDSEKRRDLQITLLETLVSGGLDMAVAGDKCQKEINYQVDTVLAELTAKQGDVMQKLYEVNFVQGGTFGSIASGLFLKHKINQASIVLLVSGGIGLGLTGLSFFALRGGTRKNVTGPNSLADFFNLRPAAEKGFSPLVYAYLSSSSPARSDGKTRRQCLIDSWTKNSVVTMNLKDRRVLEQLGGMPSCKRDSIKLVLNRIALLSSLRQEYNEFDVEVLDLLQKVWPATIATGSQNVDSQLSPSANAAAALLGVQGITAAREHSDENAKLLITRQVLEGFLSMITDADLVGHEIDVEFKVLDRMERRRDKVVQFTNNVNFLQGGVLGQVATSLGLTGRPENVLATNYLAIITSAIGIGLGAVTLVEQQGGWRPGRANPNALVAAFGKNSEHVSLSPITTRFLNTSEPNSPVNLSRREILIKYWKESKVLNVNLNKDSTIQKLSAEGRAHHRWCETINLINNRLTMLIDLRAVMRSCNVGFDELLRAVDEPETSLRVTPHISYRK